MLGPRGVDPPAQLQQAGRIPFGGVCDDLVEQALEAFRLCAESERQRGALGAAGLDLEDSGDVDDVRVREAEESGLAPRLERADAADHGRVLQCEGARQRYLEDERGRDEGDLRRASLGARLRSALSFRRAHAALSGSSHLVRQIVAVWVVWRMSHTRSVHWTSFLRSFIFLRSFGASTSRTHLSES